MGFTWLEMNGAKSNKTLWQSVHTLVVCANTFLLIILGTICKCRYVHFAVLLTVWVNYSFVLAAPIFHWQVDGDTSTNDCVIALASSLSGANKISSLNNTDAEHLQACLDAVCILYSSSIQLLLPKPHPLFPVCFFLFISWAMNYQVKSANFTTEELISTSSQGFWFYILVSGNARPCKINSFWWRRSDLLDWGMHVQKFLSKISSSTGKLNCCEVG